MKHGFVFHLGWLLLLGGGGWDLVYHLAPIYGVHWSPFLDFLGEFGHTVIFFGGFFVVFRILLKRAK